MQRSTPANGLKWLTMTLIPHIIHSWPVQDDCMSCPSQKSGNSLSTAEIIMKNRIVQLTIVYKWAVNYCRCKLECRWLDPWWNLQSCKQHSSGRTCYWSGKFCRFEGILSQLGTKSGLLGGKVACGCKGTLRLRRSLRQQLSQARRGNPKYINEQGLDTWWALLT